MTVICLMTQRRWSCQPQSPHNQCLNSEDHGSVCDIRGGGDQRVAIAMASMTAIDITALMDPNLVSMVMGAVMAITWWR